jgi:ABC-type branched-subunit amino acid transport system ATPase component
MHKIDTILEFTSLADKAQRDAASELALTELKALEVAKALATNPNCCCSTKCWRAWRPTASAASWAC